MGLLAKSQRIVIASIHQPRAAIWELFNKAQVLSEGHMLYFGPTDKARATAHAAASAPLLCSACCGARTCWACIAYPWPTQVCAEAVGWL